MGNTIIPPITKRLEIIISIQVCLISQIKCKENGGKKTFLANPKHQDHISQFGEHDCSANNRKNGDYYAHLCLSHFTDEL